ncbi:MULTISPECIES: hypothetical protein [Streptomyces]|uniref:Gram-positive cocci surface proteins LPxTG domain-containing protein n=2 Tax=Streptomyces TaxID=1883 RepID=A0A1D8GA42_9ACTN|nr:MULTISPECIES: hypothetical protein [Streptomyces]AOT62326.1 hypothetical protein A4G23_05222 [Streptomyces rubrolavendulae]OSY50811.1 hypothetical protein BG846_03561 [Streptomyces fradiae ATCC 10745 = DSM 40063]QEV15142.1 hypothetical protein CP974_27835 [Streptomyces fradiae ATCC 10745 = DSM 40063]UQS29979.1 hypothetical protein J5J01_24435 [Streptomyces fradiae]
MRASRALAVAATACAVIGFTAPIAAATDHDSHTGTGGNGGIAPTNVTVSPTHVHQGGALAVSVTGCSRGGVVTSNAFPKTALTYNTSGNSAASPRIYDHATPGRYNLAVRCTGSSRVATASFTVIRGRGTEGGLGGSMAPSSTEMAVGASMVGAAALGGAVFVNRRRRMSGGNA